MLGITTGDLPSTITGEGAGSIFQTAQWDTYTSNNMVGPEFGMMFEGSQGAWDWYAGGSFTAGFNWQNNIYKGANLPQNLGADYLRTNFAGGGVTTVNFSSPAAGNDSTSVVSVPTSPLIVQVFPTGQSAVTNSAEHDFSFSYWGMEVRRSLPNLKSNQFQFWLYGHVVIQLPVQVQIPPIGVL